jgi:hypothetical protein
LYRVYIYGREYRMRRNRNGRNVQLGPQGDDSSPPPLSPLIFFEGDRCLCLTRKFAVKA